jgi:hypothetical protein
LTFFVTEWRISHTAKKEKEKIEAGKPSLKAIFSLKLPFMENAFKTVDHTLLRTWLGWRGTQPGSDIRNYAFSQPQCISFSFCILFTLVGITIFQEPDVFPSLNLHRFWT